MALSNESLLALHLGAGASDNYLTTASSAKDETKNQSVQESLDELFMDIGSGGGGAVESVNGRTGIVVLTAEDVGALPDDTELFSGDYNDLDNKPTIPTVPTNVSAFTNDAGYLTTNAVSSVNGRNGIVVLDAEDVGALPDNTELFSGNYNDLSNKPTIPTVPSNVSAFTNDAGYLTSHQDIGGKVDKSAQATKSSDMTQAIGIDTNGKLWTEGGWQKEIYQQDDEPDDANEGDIWIDTSEEDGVASDDIVRKSDQVIKTSSMTAEVGIDSNGKLWAATGSVNGMSGNILLGADDVGALPIDTHIPSALSELEDDSGHRLVTDTEKSTWAAKYSKPSSGIPETDLASAVQMSLGKADNSVQQVSGKGLSTNDYTTEEKNKLAGIAPGATNVQEHTISDWGFAREPMLISFTIHSNDWVGTSSPYSVGLMSFGFNHYMPDAAAKIDITANVTTMQQLLSDGVISIVAENRANEAEEDEYPYYVYAFGAKPTTDIELWAICQTLDTNG